MSEEVINQEELYETIRKLYARQVPISSIAGICKLSIKEVENIINEIYSKKEEPEVYLRKSLDVLTEIQSDLNKIIMSCQDELNKSSNKPFVEKEKIINTLTNLLRFKTEIEDKKISLQQTFITSGVKKIVFKETTKPFGIPYTIAEIKEQLRKINNVKDKALYLLGILGYTNDTISSLTDMEREFIISLTEMSPATFETLIWRIQNGREKIVASLPKNLEESKREKVKTLDNILKETK